MIYTKESDCAWHYRDTLSETFTFLSYFRGLLRGVWGTRETAAHLPLAPFSFLSSGTESRAHSGRGARPSSASMRPLSSNRTSPACRASPWQLRASSAPPYPRPPSCGPEAGRAGGLWEEAVSDGAASARDGEAAVGPEPEVGGVRGRVRAGARGGAGRGGPTATGVVRRLGRSRRRPRRKGGGGLPYFGCPQNPRRPRPRRHVLPSPTNRFCSISRLYRLAEGSGSRSSLDGIRRFSRTAFWDL